MAAYVGVYLYSEVRSGGKPVAAVSMGAFVPTRGRPFKPASGAPGTAAAG